MDARNVKITDPQVVEELTYNDERIAIFDTVPSGRLLGKVRLDGVLVLLCVDGVLTIDIDDKTYEAGRNDIIICSPDAVIVRGGTSGDFKFCGLFMSLEYAIRILPISVRSWNFKVFFEQHPQIHLNDREVTVFRDYYNLMKMKFADRSNPYRGNIVDALMQAFVFDFRRLLDRFAGLKPRPMSSAENIFNDFIDILSRAYPKSRSVAFYARQLNITPKYLSVVCKKTSGKNASKVIDAYVAKDIENLLKSSSKSVKEISNELDFPNTSFFGRYVKKNLGHTPNELRRLLNGFGRDRKG